MKIRTLAIALTLSLLCSLFAFGIPVSAAGKGGGPENAAVPSGFQEYTLSHTSQHDIPSEGTTIWLGPPITPYEGTIKITTNRIWYFPDCGGSFGEGDCYWYFETRNNYQTGTAFNRGILEWRFDNEEYQGTIIITRDVSTFKSGLRTGHLNVVGGTGDFENFHGEINVWETIPAGTLIMEGKFS